MTEHSTDYHDYVFRDGALVGEFDAMYRHSEGVPWHQDEQRDWVDVRLTVEMLRGLGPFTHIHDLGCGLGYYLDLLRNALGSPDCRAFGYDISATACDKARKLFPGYTFSEMDLRLDRAAPAIPVRCADPGLFVIRGTLWYVFPNLANVVNNIRRMMSGADVLLVVQNFPPLERSFIGKDVIPDAHALMRHFSTCFPPIRHIWYEDALGTSNDNWFIGLFSPR
ncbi:MAG: class I SAM-dependent methyltransferase [Steroidobacteraceae bacterium]